MTPAVAIALIAAAVVSVAMILRAAKNGVVTVRKPAQATAPTTAQPAAPDPPTATEVAAWLTTAQVRALLHLRSDTTVKQMARDGRLTTVWTHSGRRYDPESVAAYASTNGTGAAS
jgi:hypothetical protein